MRQPIHFEVDGLTFEFRAMSLPDACAGMRMWAATGGDLMSLGGLESLPKLVDLFAGYCRVQGPDVGGGRNVELKAFAADVFSSQVDRAMLFVANCATAEFSDFLGAGHARVSAGLDQIAKRWPAPTAPTPGSGDSR